MWKSDSFTLAVTQSAVPQIAISGPIAAIIATIVLLWILWSIGKRVPSFVKIDDYLRVVVALFGITGALLSIPALSGLRNGAYNVVVASVASANGQKTATAVTVFILAGIGAAIYGKRGRFGNLLLFVPLTVSLFHYEGLFKISNWYVEHIGQPLFDGLVGFVKAIVVFFTR